MMHQPIDAEDVERFERMNRNLSPNTAKACLDGSLGILNSTVCAGDVPTSNGGKLGEPSEYDIMGEEDCLVRRES